MRGGGIHNNKKAHLATAKLVASASLGRKMIRIYFLLLNSTTINHSSFYSFCFTSPMLFYEHQRTLIELDFENEREKDLLNTSEHDFENP